MRSLRYLAALAAVFGCGCVQLEQVLTIRKDGSGVVELAYSISEQAVTQFKAMSQLRRQMTPDTETPANPAPDWINAFLDPDEPELVSIFKRFEVDGVKVLKLRVESRNARRYVNIEMPFTTLQALAQTELFRYAGLTLAKNSQGNYVLHRAGAGTTPDGPGVDLRDPDTLKQIRPLLAGFNVEFRLNVPGRIIRTNATRHSVYAAVWTYNFDQDPRAFTAVQDPRVAVLFEGEGLVLPEIKPAS